MDNTEKIWAHRTIAAGGLGGAVSPPGDPGQCLGEGMGVKPLNIFFFHMKHAKLVITKVNIW